MTNVALLIVVLAGGGAAPAAGRQNTPECRPLDTPKQLPALSALLDSAQIGRGIAEAQLAEGSEVRLGLAFARSSGPPAAWVSDSGVIPESRTRVAALVQAALRPHGAPPGTTLRLHVRVSRAPALRIERSMLCAPTPLDSAKSAQPSFQMSEAAKNGPPRRWKATVRQRIGTDGRVLEAQLQPGSGRVEIDRLALEPVYARRWRPATLDGRPIVVWLADGRAELPR
jgi:hypothetical protein